MHSKLKGIMIAIGVVLLGIRNHAEQRGKKQMNPDTNCIRSTWGFSRSGVVLATLVCLTAGIEVQAAQDLPAVRVVLNRAKTAQIPKIKYEVTVLQTVAASTTQGVSLSVRAATSFTAVFSPAKGLKRIVAKPAKTAETTPVMTVLVDIGAFLDEVLAYPKPSISPGKFRGRACFRLEGSEAHGVKKCVLWVDQETSCVKHIEVFLFNKNFADVDVEYGERRGRCWLPRKITLRHHTDGSIVILDFVDYKFNDSILVPPSSTGLPSRREADL